MPDLAFHCFRITTEVQYLARAEIASCIQAIKDADDAGSAYVAANSVHRKIIEHYQRLDESIREIFEELQPENYLFVADHSASIFEYEGNVDIWLEAKGYLHGENILEEYWRKISKLGRKLLNKLLVEVGLAKPPVLIRRPLSKFSARKTKAFGTFYDTGNFAGIFINDQDRFGGDIKNTIEVDNLVNEICEKFNSDAQVIEHSMSARPYRRNFSGAKFQRLMPDIKIDKPDTIYFSSRRPEFICPNPNLKTLQESLENIRYPHTGLKGSDPLFVYSRSLEECIAEDDPNDLRLAYRMICRFFNA
jgi:hypothetical protein